MATSRAQAYHKFGLGQVSSLPIFCLPVLVGRAGSRLGHSLSAGYGPGHS